MGELTRRTDPETSHEAEDFVTPNLNNLQQTVLGWAQTRTTPWTDKQLVAAMQARVPLSSESTWRTRRKELVEKNLIHFAGYYHVDGAGKKHSLWLVGPKPING